MLKQILSLILLLTIKVSFGQKIEISWSEPQKKQGIQVANQELIGSYNNFYYVLNQPDRENTILQFDFNHKLINSTSYDFKVEGKNLKVGNILHTKNGAFLIGNAQSKNKKEDFLYFSKIQANGKLTTDLNLLFSYDKRKRVGGFNQTSYFLDAKGWKVSQDSTKILFVTADEKSKKEEKYYINIFNENLELLWENNIELPFKNKDLKLKDFSISNNGEVYFLVYNTSVDRRWKNPGWDLPRGDYEVYKVDNKNNIKPIKISIDQSYAREANIIVLQDGSFYAIGFFTIKEARVSFEDQGIFINKYSNEGELVFESKVDFKNGYDDAFIEGLGMKKFKKGEYRLNYLANYKTIVDFELDKISMICEFAKIDKIGKNVIFNSKGFFVPVFSLDGKIKYTSFIPRRLESNYNMISSYDNGNLYFLFNSQKSLKELKDLGIKNKFFVQVIDLAHVDNSGKLVFSKMAFNSNTNSTDFIARKSLTLKDNKFIIFTNNNKYHTYGILNLTEIE